MCPCQRQGHISMYFSRTGTAICLFKRSLQPYSANYKLSAFTQLGKSWERRRDRLWYWGLGENRGELLKGRRFRK